MIFFRYLIPILAGFWIAGCATISTIPPVSQPPAPEGIFHIVQKGETLWSIAKTYDIDIHEIQQFNTLDEPDRIQAGQRILIPLPEIPAPVFPPDRLIPLDRAIERRVGPKFSHSKWRYITVHHSATRQGSAEAFHRDHRRRKMGGLFYHFVIGNGSGSDDGEVEVGWRWKKQVRSKKSRPQDIQICLVGNFSQEQVSEAQFTSLANLIHVLQRQYHIPLSHVRRHKDIYGSTTECPGNHFPFFWLLSELKKTDLAARR